MSNADALKQAGEILLQLGNANDDKNFLAVSVFLNKLAKVYIERDEKELI